MMSGVPLETCWAFNKLWNNKFYYKAASRWYFYCVVRYIWTGRLPHTRVGWSRYLSLVSTNTFVSIPSLGESCRKMQWHMTLNLVITIVSSTFLWIGFRYKKYYETIKLVSTVLIAQSNICTVIRLAQTAMFSSILTARPANCAMSQSTRALRDGLHY